MSRADLQRAVGYLQYSNMYRVERGTIAPTAEKVAAIARVLGTTSQYLLTGDDADRHIELDEWLAQLPSQDPVSIGMARAAWERATKSTRPPPMPEPPVTPGKAKTSRKPR